MSHANDYVLYEVMVMLLLLLLLMMMMMTIMMMMIMNVCCECKNCDRDYNSRIGLYSHSRRCPDAEN